jgi:hypothetical protein
MTIRPFTRSRQKGALAGMTERSKPERPAERQARLLRANLARRKAQARLRAASQPDGEADAGEASGDEAQKPQDGEA